MYVFQSHPCLAGRICCRHHADYQSSSRALSASGITLCVSCVIILYCGIRERGARNVDSTTEGLRAVREVSKSPNHQRELVPEARFDEEAHGFPLSEHVSCRQLPTEADFISFPCMLGVYVSISM